MGTKQSKVGAVWENMATNLNGKRKRDTNKMGNIFLRVSQRSLCVRWKIRQQKGKPSDFKKKKIGPWFIVKKFLEKLQALFPLWDYKTSQKVLCVALRSTPSFFSSFLQFFWYLLPSWAGVFLQKKVYWHYWRMRQGCYEWRYSYVDLRCFSYNDEEHSCDGPLF